MLNKALLSIIAVLVIVALFFGLKGCNTDKALSEQTSLLLATQDSVSHYKDKLGRETIAKHVAEASLTVLQANYNLLSVNQKKLADNIKQLPKAQQSNLITAAEIKQEVRIGNIIQIDSTHHWEGRSDTLNYSIRTTGDTLRIDSLSLPNQLFLTQYREKNGAIVITATNSNPLIKNRDIDSITIPNKKPSLLLKILLFAAGVAGGIYISH